MSFIFKGVGFGVKILRLFLFVVRMVGILTILFITFLVLRSPNGRTMNLDIPVYVRKKGKSDSYSMKVLILILTSNLEVETLERMWCMRSKTVNILFYINVFV